MARFKDFGTGDQDKPVEELHFSLHGEDFQCKPKIQGKVLLDLIARSNAQENPAEAAKLISEFFGIVLLKESFERFTALTLSEDKIIDVEQLSDIVAWLVEEYAKRPTPLPLVS